MALIKGKQIQSLHVDKLVQTDDKQTVSLLEKQSWSGKADTTLATQVNAGLMSPEDKLKLDNLEADLQNYAHPETHPASMIVEDETRQFVSAQDKLVYVDKYTVEQVDNLINGVKAGIEWLSSVATYEDLATTYPTATHNSVALVDADNKAYRYESSTQTWEYYPIAGYGKATQELDGLMSSMDKIKLDGVEAGANNYVHPENHPASMITQDADHQLVNATQVAAWDAKADKTVATTTKDGLMSSTDKTKLNGLSNGFMKTIAVFAATAGAQVIPTGIHTDGTGAYHTKHLAISIAVNGLVQAVGADKDFTISESAQNEIMIQYNNRHYALDTDDEIVVTYTQTA